MDLSRFTEKAQEALLQAQSLAGEYGHGQIEGEHLLLVLLSQSDGVVPVILQGLGLQIGRLTQQVEGELARKSKVYGGTAQVGLSRELEHSLDRAVKISQATYGELLKLRGDAGADDPVFRSQKGGHLHIV